MKTIKITNYLHCNFFYYTINDKKISLYIFRTHKTTNKIEYIIR